MQHDIHILGLTPSSQLQIGELESVVEWCSSVGIKLDSMYNPSYSVNAAIDDLQKLKDNFITAFSSPSTNILWALRGGYGSAFLADEISENLYRNLKHKILIGCSDITALFLALTKSYGYKCIHAPVAIQVLDNLANTEYWLELLQLFQAVQNKSSCRFFMPDLKAIYTTIPRTIDAVTIGGNLTVITSSIGTKWQIDCADKILMLEDVDEPLYKIDRMLTQLLQSGILSSAKAIVCGSFNNADEDYFTPVELLEGLQAKLGIPVFYNAKFGHGKENSVFAINHIAKIDHNDAYGWHFEQHIDFSYLS